MEKFETIYQRAAKRKGGADALDGLLRSGSPPVDLAEVSDDRYLAEMTKRIFCAGFVWKVIEHKWPNFEHAFHGFDVDKMAILSDDDLSELAQDERIVRNAQKIQTVRANANFILDIAHEHGSFGHFLAKWPESDQSSLLALLKKRGSRLGGMTAQYFLRFVGKDSFILSTDVVAALVHAGVIDNHKATSAKDQRAIQAAFNQWHEESGRSYTDMSRILAMSTDT